MNKKILLYSTLSIGVIAGMYSAASMLGNRDAAFVSRSAQMDAPTVDDALALYKAERLDENGVYNPALIRQTREQIKQMIAEGSMNRASNLAWIEEGPDNIGGRTRAILIDDRGTNHVWAGSVSGGLFYSSTFGNTWARIDSFEENLAIASICQDGNGRIYVGTGFDNGNYFNEGFTGNGLYYSDDYGTTWVNVAGTSNTDFAELKADPNVAGKIWCATSSGLKSFDGSTFTTAPGTPASKCHDLQVSKDGQFIVAGISGSIINTWVSTDAGASFADVSGSGATQIPRSGASRIVYAISHEKNDNNQWNVFASIVQGSGGTLKGVYISEDNGQTWTEIAPGGSQFDPYISANGQGVYNNIASGIPGNPNQFLLGGIDVYAWTRAANINPAFGQWEQRSLWFASPISPVYVHADNHEMVWDENDILFIGNDGGIGKSPDKGQTFFAANKGYNVTQYYGIGYSADGDVMGGSQDNGTTINRHEGVSLRSFESVRGGDGFDCDISHIDDDVIFASVYYGDVERSDDGGASFDGMGLAPGDGFPFQFRTCGRLYENANDLNSTDSFNVIANQDYLAGDTLFYNSQTLQKELYVILTAPLLEDDTIRVVDPIQTLYAVSIYNNSTSTNEVLVTREAMRFNTTPNWYPVLSGKDASALEFSADGDHLFIGTWDGKVYRVSGFNNMYMYTSSDDPSTVLTTTQIYNGSSPIGGIAIDANDPDHVVITLTGYSSGRVLESVTAATTVTTTTFNSIHGSSLPSIPVYDAVINVNNPDQVIIGTEFGVYVTDNINGSSTVWTYQNQTNGPGLVPVYAVRQQWRSWSEGTNRPGEVYIGTHGRGIWRSEDLLSVRDEVSRDNTNVVLPVRVFPNPMVDNGTISFETKENSDVTVNVFALNGQMVKTIALGNRNAGVQNVSINAGDLANGTYIIHVSAGNYKHQGRMVIAK
jgi:hypothetical protein